MSIPTRITTEEKLERRKILEKSYPKAEFERSQNTRMKTEDIKMTSASFHTSEDWPLAYPSGGSIYGPYGAAAPGHSSLLSMDEFPSSYWSTSMALVDNYDINDDEMHNIPPR